MKMRQALRACLFSYHTSCAGAPDVVAYPPPRRHSPATRASRACRDGAAGRGPRRNAARSSYRTRRAASGVGAGTPHGPHGLPGAPHCAALSADRAGFQEQRSRCSCGTSAGGEANCEREALAAGECRRGGAGAGIGRASARCLATRRGGRSPPRVKTRGRAGVRESRPAAELPGISTRGRTAGHLDRRQSARRESQPAAELPGISTGGRTMLNRRRNCRESRAWSLAALRRATVASPEEVGQLGEPLDVDHLALGEGEADDRDPTQAAET
ncbi:MAG: hypothetical protein JWM18_4290 [Chloroflexi bacterium]|nr:hypothetical protein [Chloroflexota bacterium]